MNWQYHIYILISNLGVTFGDNEREATEKNLFGVWQKWGQIDKKFHAEFPSIFLNAVSCDRNLRMKSLTAVFIRSRSYLRIGIKANIHGFYNEKRGLRL